MGDHPDLATTENNLAALYAERGSFSRAESLYKEALDMRVRTLGADHPDVADCLKGLALLYQDMGAYYEAEPLYKRALSIQRKTLNPEHPKLGSTLYGLAELYRNMGELEKAEPLIEQSLKIKIGSLGKDHPDVATILNNMGLLYHDKGDYGVAEVCYRQAWSVGEAALGADHPEVLNYINNTAVLYHDAKQYSQAEFLYGNVLSLLKEAFGSVHPYVASIQRSLAYLYLELGDYHKSLDALHDSIATSEKLIDDVFTFASDRQKQSFLSKHKRSLQLLLEITIDHFKSDFKKVSTTADHWLRRKGRLLESQRLFMESLLSDPSAEVRNLARGYRKTKGIWSNLVFSGSGQGDIDQYKANLDEIQKQHDDLEKKLIKLSSKFSKSQKSREISWKDVADALPDNAVLIDFASLSDRRFLAFVIHSGSDNGVQLIDLGTGKGICKLIQDLRIQISKGKDENKDFDEKLYYQLSRELYQRIIKPLKEALGTVGHYVISPDGALCLLPFEILINENNEYLMEEEGRLISYITAPRDLLYGPEGERRNRALLIGDPDYDWDGYINTESDSGDNRPGSENNKEGNRSFLLADHEFGRVKPTTYEVNEIASQLNGKYEFPPPFTRTEAREELLSEARDLGIIHIATHGFFLPIKRRKERGTLDRDDKHGFPMARSADSEAEVYVENPLLRSGLAFAGANVTLKKKTGSQGILTAEKVLSLPLRGTDLLVLSACNTGIGDVSVGEGVFGLQRAFSLAGVANLVMSLWKVPDYKTKDLMVKFYKYMIVDDESPRIALSRATKDQLKIMRKHFKTKYPNPYFWSGFVLSGRP